MGPSPFLKCSSFMPSTSSHTCLKEQTEQSVDSPSMMWLSVRVILSTSFAVSASSLHSSRSPVTKMTQTWSISLFSLYFFMKLLPMARKLMPRFTACLDTRTCSR